MQSMTDQCGREVSFQTSPKRIISLVPSITELLCELGLEERIVGITKFCVHPYHLKSVKAIVGGTKKVNFDKISGLNPDIIICNKEENTEEIVGHLEKIHPVWVTDIITLDDNLKMISDFGQIFNCRTQASNLAFKIQFAKDDFVKYVQNFPPIKCAYFIWKDPFMAVGANTFIHEMLLLCGFKNIYESRGRYPEVIIQKMRIQGDPEVVFLSSEPYPFKDEDAFEIGRFTHHAKVIFVDGEMFSWYGSRPLKAFSYFRKVIEKSQ